MEQAEQQETVETAEQTPAQEAPQETAQETNEDKPPGYYPVETDDPKVKERIDYIYSQLKQDKREKNEYKRIAAEQSRLLAELQNNQGIIVNHIADKTFAETEVQVKAALRTAIETGDIDGQINANERLAEIKAQKLNVKNNVQQPKQQQQNIPNNTVELARQAEGEGEISYDDRATTEAWQNERDENGQLLRSWAFNKSGDPNRMDPNYQAALVEMNAVFNSPRFENSTFQQKLAEIDRRMGVNKSSGGQTVLRGGFTGKSKPAKVALSSQAEQIAIKTKFGSKNGAKSDAEYIAAYRKQMETVKQGSRK